MRLDAEPALDSHARTDKGMALLDALGSAPVGDAVADGLLLAATATAYILPPLRGKQLGRLALDTVAATSGTLTAGALVLSGLALAWVLDGFRTGSGSSWQLVPFLVGVTLTGPLAAMLVDRLQGHALSLEGLLVAEGLVAGVDLLALWGFVTGFDDGAPALLALGMGALGVWGWSAGGYTLYTR